MTWVLVRVVGKTLAEPDGEVRSLNPSSNDPPYGPYQWGLRPYGTAGPYELCECANGIAVYNPTGKEPVVFGFQAVVPNTPGLSAVTVDPL